MHPDLVQALLLGQLQQGEEMVLVGVHALVLHQAHQVQGGIVLPAVLDRLEQGRVLEKALVPDGAADVLQHLHDYPAGAQIGVAGLAVALHSRRQPNGLTAGLHLRVGKVLPIRIEVGRPGQGDGVARAFGRQPPTVQNQQDNRSQEISPGYLTI